MRAWLMQMAWKLQKFMVGRNGLDVLAKHCYFAGLILMVLSVFDRSGILNLLSTAFLVYSVFRTLSKNLPKRQSENYKYVVAYNKLLTAVKQRKMRFQERKEYRFFKCSCGAVLRVRRGQGVKELTCPICHEHMTRDTK